MFVQYSRYYTDGMYLHSCIQSLGNIETLQFLVKLFQMLFDWFTDQVVIL